jgi:NADH-quinone oxidoreductase subunit K
MNEAASAAGFLTVGLSHYLTVSAILLTLGIFGIFLNRKNLIVIMMSIELMLLAVNINLVAFSSFLNDLVGQVFTMLVLTVAAAEAAIGLAIVVVFYRNRRTIEVEDINQMKG